MKFSVSYDENSVIYQQGYFIFVWLICNDVSSGYTFWINGNILIFDQSGQTMLGKYYTIKKNYLSLRGCTQFCTYR